MNKYSGMSIAEALMVFLIVGIILTVAITTIVSDDIRTLPFVHSTMKNLPKINKIISEECFYERGCRSVTELPEDIEYYCTKLSELLATSGPVNCTRNGGASYTYNGKTYYRSFKLSNGVSFFNLAQTDWITPSSGITTPYIDVYFDVNGTGDPNKYGEDFFGIRIFQNGEVVPSSNNIGGVVDFDREIFAYNVVLNSPVSTQNRNSRKEEPVKVLVNGEQAQRLTYRQALCAARGVNMLRRYYGNSYSCSVSVANQCLGSNGSYCYVKLVKPGATGIFKVFENN